MPLQQKNLAHDATTKITPLKIVQLQNAISKDVETVVVFNIVHSLFISECISLSESKLSKSDPAE